MIVLFNITFEKNIKMEFEKKPLNKVIRGSKRANYDKDTVYSIVDSHVLCHVAYLYESCPITIPTGYGRKGDTIYLHGSLKNRMIASLKDAEKLSITITHLDGFVLARSVFHHSVNYRSAILFGKPRLVDEPEEKMEALKLITENFNPGRWSEARHPNQKEFDGTLVIAVDIEDASAKIRDVGVNDEVEDLQLPIWAGVVPLSVIAGEPLPEKDLLDGVETPDSVSRIVGKEMFID